MDDLLENFWLMVFLVVGVIFLPAYCIVDSYANSGAYIRTNEIDGMDTSYYINDSKTYVHVKNNSKYYYNEVAVKFNYYDVLGLPIREGDKYMEREIVLGKIAPGETKQGVSEVIPREAVNAEIVASKKELKE